MRHHPADKERILALMLALRSARLIVNKYLHEADSVKERRVAEAALQQIDNALEKVP